MGNLINFQVFNKELRELGFNFGIINGRPVPCNFTNCAKCELCNNSPESICEDLQWEWMLSEFDGFLSKQDRAFCECFTDSSNFFIARDQDGGLNLHSSEPERWENCWKGCATPHELNPEMFKFITWESGKAWTLEEIRNLEKVGEENAGFCADGAEFGRV